jgi:diphthamide synthase (EF-2-diphthine--ammonia ligase)
MNTPDTVYTGLHFAAEWRENSFFAELDEAQVDAAIELLHRALESAPNQLTELGKRVLRGVIGVIRAAKRRQRANRLCDRAGILVVSTRLR